MKMDEELKGYVDLGVKGDLNVVDYIKLKETIFPDLCYKLLKMDKWNRWLFLFQFGIGERIEFLKNNK